jgi:thiosulfate reductase cytochrome b subunit
MASSTSIPLGESLGGVARAQSRHSVSVRLTHWATTLAFFALLLTGGEIVISHPRFYWGETGNVNTQALFQIPIPSSRWSVKTGYGYIMQDQNGWSRYLHFEAAWLLVLAGLVYVGVGLWNGHFRRNLLPARGQARWQHLAETMRGHLRIRHAPDDLTSYNSLQRITYLAVIFLLFPLVIWTGLDMSPAFAGQFPWAVSILGGRQSARTIHFFVSILLTLFVLVHVAMVCRSGFQSRMRAMTIGRPVEEKELNLL